MELLELTSNNPKFKTIKFSQGLNIIVGTQLTQERKKTINGIGKSLSLTLIHYILGAKFNTQAEKKFEKFLAEYGEFELSFIHNGSKINIKKDFSIPDFYINDEKVLKKDYSKELNYTMLGDYNHKPSFRQIFNCFARRYSSDVSYYSNILTQQSRPIEDFKQQYTNLSLLGIDLHLVNRNYEIKDKLAKLNNAKKTIKAYQKALEESNINDIKDEISFLNIQLKNFIIAENFDKLKSEADFLTEKLNSIRNEIFFIEKKLDRKKKNLESATHTNVDLQEIEKIYQEVNFFFSESLTKRLNDSQKFHESLITNRKKRLSIEIKELQLTLDKMLIERDEISVKRDALMKDLNNCGALEERDSIINRIKSKEAEQHNLEKYEIILSDFKKEKTNLEVDEALVKKESVIYLEKKSDYFEKIENSFRSLVKRFYDNKGGSFKFNEANSAKYLYNIFVHIPKEGSQGVGEVKIFCYDLLLFLLNKELLGFLAHDGYLFSEMDKRQKATIFKVIIDIIKDNKLQYFVNIGDSSLNEILSDNIDILSDDEKEIIKDSIILELTDKNPSDWLFGVSFD